MVFRQFKTCLLKESKNVLPGLTVLPLLDTLWQWYNKLIVDLDYGQFSFFCSIWLWCGFHNDFNALFRSLSLPCFGTATVEYCRDDLAVTLQSWQRTVVFRVSYWSVRHGNTSRWSSSHSVAFVCSTGDATVVSSFVGAHPSTVASAASWRRGSGRISWNTHVSTVTSVRVQRSGLHTRHSGTATGFRHSGCFTNVVNVSRITWCVCAAEWNECWGKFVLAIAVTILSGFIITQFSADNDLLLTWILTTGWGGLCQSTEIEWSVIEPVAKVAFELFTDIKVFVV